MTKVFEGVVISKKMINTAVVEVGRIKAHPLYKKLLKRDKKKLADTSSTTVSVGDRVKIVETKPISKTKHFKVVEVLKK